MIRHNRWKIWAMILAAVAVLMVLYYYGAVREQPEKKQENYSVILYQNTDNEWETLMEGMKQAEDDLQIDLNYITMSVDDSASDQAEMIQREVDAGAAGILLAAVDSEGLARELEIMNLEVPLICVETGVSEDVAVIRGDDYKMGMALGQKILRDMEDLGGERKVTVLCEYLERDSVRLRYEGLCEVLNAAEPAVEIQECSRSKGDYSLRLFVGTLFQECGNYLVALDKYAAEEAGAAWASDKALYQENGHFINLYGIGNTGQTVNDLDNENICALMYQNEFNMGYQGLKCLVERRNRHWIEHNISIKFKLVTKETLYEYENERLLFPNV